jgi:hypothetical protein
MERLRGVKREVERETKTNRQRWREIEKDKKIKK